MRKFIVYASLLLLGSDVFGQNLISFSGNYRNQLGLSWTKKKKFSSSAECYPFGKAAEVSDLSGETVNDSGIFENVTAIRQSISTSRGPIPGLILTQRSVSPIARYELGYQINLQDGAPKTGHFTDPNSDDCTSEQYHWRLDNHRVDGQVTANIQMPADRWFVELRFGRIDENRPSSDIDYSGEVQLAPNLQGDLHSAALLRDRMIVWARPGSKFQLKLPLAINSGGGTLARFRIYLKFYNSAPSTHPTERIQLLKQRFATADREALNNEFAPQLLELGASLLKTPSAGSSIVGNLTLNEYFSQLDWLFGIANSTSLEGLEFREAHVKAVAAIVGYQLSLALLEDFQQYCAPVEMELPLTGGRSRLPGYLAAYLILRPSMTRIQTMDFNAARVFISETMTSYQQRGLTFQQVSQNPTEMERIRRSYRAISQSGVLSPAPFADFERAVQRIRTQVGISTFTQDSEREVLGAALAIRNQMTVIRDQFYRFSMAFNAQNIAAVNSGDLLTLINQAEASILDFKQNKLSRFKFSSSDPDSSRQSYVVDLTSLLAHQVAIFDEPLRNQFIEPIRLAFAETQRVSRIRESHNRCLRGDFR